MTSWKSLLTVGLACAACCALPLIGAGAVMGSALLARVDTALALAALAATGGAILWRRRKARMRNSGCGASCGKQCRLP